MKSWFLSFLLVGAVGLAAAADNPSLTGNWQIHNSIAGNESDQTCSFTQKGENLTGSCSSASGTVNINGKVDQKKVTWTYKSEYNGGPLTMTYEGNCDSATKMAGTVKVEEYGVTGEFTATQSK